METVPIATNNQTTESLPALRIACFGDSLTEGYCRRGSRFHPYARFLIQHLSEIYPDREINVNSYGISGDLTHHMRRRLVKDVFSMVMTMAPETSSSSLAEVTLTQAKFDIVVILGGTNDLGHGIDHADIIANLQWIAQTVRTNGAVPFVLSVPALGSRLFDESHYEEQVALNRQIADLCSINEYIFVDLFRETASELDPRMLADNVADKDGLHFSRDGYQIMAKIIGTSIVRWLEEADGWNKLGLN